METNFWTQLQRPILALAPMVGISDSAFRQVAKRFGADVVYSEMISADAVVHDARKTLAMMDHVPAEQPLVVQLMGKDPSVLARAARVAEAHGAAGIDINFGCPAHKIAKNQCGAMLMRDLALCRKLIAATIEAVTMPVSIKVRVSIKKESGSRNHDSISILDLLAVVRDLPIAALMVHGRSFEDPFEGGIREDVIRQVKERFISGLVIANGGITTVESSRDVLHRTGADGLGLARSVIGRPWVFSQIREYLASGSYADYSWETVRGILAQHVELFDLHRGQKPFREIRRHLSHYVKGHERASELRQRLALADSVSDVSAALNFI